MNGKQQDWIGAPQDDAPFRDIGNQRPSVAEQKAILSLELHKLCSRAPKKLASAGVIQTRAWVAAATECKKVAANSRSTIPQLTAAISRMQALGD